MSHEQNLSHQLAFDRVLPNSLEAEMAVLGAMLLDPVDAAAEVRERVSQKHFYYAAHQVIFREFVHLQEKLQAVDAVTLMNRLSDKGLLEEVGGAVFLADLVQRVPTTANVAHYMDIVIRDYVRRKVINECHGAIANAFDKPDLDDWLPQYQQAIVDSHAGHEKKIKPFAELVKGTMLRVEEWYANPGAVNGLSTGLRDLDNALGGLKPKQFIVFAGRPGHGKSSLALDIAAHNALTGHDVGVFSLEMGEEELSDRTVVGHANVNLRKLQSGKCSDKAFPALTASAAKFIKAGIWIDDEPALTIDQIRARSRRMKLKYNIKLVIIDYVQLARAIGKYNNRENEVAEVSRGCKALAKELDLPVIGVCQLNRQADGQDLMPKLSWLRESGQLEQDADVVGFLVRPEMHEEDADKRAELKGQAILTIAKQRGGPTGDVKLTYLAEYTRFEDCAVVGDADVPPEHRRDDE